MAHFGASSTGYEEVVTGAERVKDRTFVVTGRSDGGIGAETAISLAAGAPRQLVLVRRNIRNVRPVIEKIEARKSSILGSYVRCDLSSQSSVHKAAAEITDFVSQLDVMINSAVRVPSPFSKTEDGIESQFGITCIGHFPLTNLLIPKILAAKPGARIVNVSSSAYGHATRPPGEDYNSSHGAT